ncbi:hypothetical protein ACJMK2_038980 [Sinanodonta woodiana]|uniref:Sushi, von Willebrand factor type A, EGF and pentraxin domain-containing protein 1 n=1 Tax=Sinanodonta woodiana TaxID=1069815 RepID=A0ABD3WEI7_SINWO
MSDQRNRQTWLRETNKHAFKHESAKQVCSISDLPHRNVSEEFHCMRYNESLIFDAESDLVPVNTKCVHSIEPTVVWDCFKGIWRKSTISDLDLTLALSNKTSHHREKRFFWLIALIICAFVCFAKGSSSPPQDRKPPNFNYHPADQYLTGIPGQLHAIADWAEPTAHDETDGVVRVERQGQAPRTIFGNGVTHISYTAKDRSGNLARVSFKIVVDVIYCQGPSAIANGYYLCHPQNPFVLGSICKFGCYDGFELVGPREITCLRTRSWSSTQPTCKPWTCPKLPSIPKATLSCTQENYFRSVCSYSCETGYDMPNNTARALICTIDRSWKKHGEPECQDVEPPIFNTCPSVILEGADRDFAPVTWEVPTTRDNSKLPVVTRLVRGSEPGTPFAVGTHEIEYLAADQNGNLARPCMFKVVVKEIRCHKLYPTPYMTISCPQGYKSGSFCSFDCDYGKNLFGSRVATCKREPGKLFGLWSFDKTQPACKAGTKCEQLKPPNNGAVVCDVWRGGSFCQFQCMENTTMLDKDWRQLFVCSDSGLWRPTRIDADCQWEIRGGTPIGKAFLLYYFSGNCFDAATQEAIRLNFHNLVQNDTWSSSACKGSTQCNVQNTEVRCGEQTLPRTRRDVHAQNRLEVVVTIQLSSTEQAYQTVHKKVATMFQHLEETLTNTNVSSLMYGLDLTFGGIYNKTMGIICPVGSTPVPDMYACVNCSAGTFYHTASMTCVKCEKGWYQDLSGQLTCIRCPEFTTTRSTGAISEASCESACEPGQWSSDGVSPCSLCEAGTYQTSYGQIQCNRCPGSQTTLSLGAISSDMCKDYDIAFPDGHAKHCILKLNNSLAAATFTVVLWIQINRNSSGKIVRLTDGPSEILSLELETKLTLSFAGENFTTTIAITDERWHYVALLKDICSTTLYVDNESSLTQHNCTETIHFDTVLLGNDDFTGSISQLNVWSSSNAKQRRDKCFSESVGDMIPWYLFEEADLSEAYMQIPSFCDDADECSSSPCMHGSCQDGLHSFTCTCYKGFTGIRCDVNIDDCTVNVCMNQSTCVDGTDGYTCLCPSSYTGQFCEIKMVDGQWGAWSNWSECSLTCDLGVRTRTRLCDRPTPDNGGLSCFGEGLEAEPCNETTCPVCPEISPPANGSISCNNDTRNINCTVQCEEGYQFDIEPLDFYLCGEDTAHEWNFQTEDNPNRRLPKCTAIQPAEEVGFTLRYWYEELTCESVEAEVVIKSVREKTRQVINGTDCVTHGLCTSKDATILNCNKERRERRSAGRNTVGFTITLTTSPASGDSDLILQQLDRAYRMLVEAAITGSFTVFLTGTTYVLQTNGTEVLGIVSCPNNLMRVDHFCIPCGEGSYLSDGYCKLCGYGFYQDLQGQSSCRACPKHWTTGGKGSTSEEDCSEIVIVACSVTAAVIAIAVIIIAVRIYQQKMLSKVEPCDIAMYGADRHDQVSKLKYLSSDMHSSNRKYTTPSFHSLREMYI